MKLIIHLCLSHLFLSVLGVPYKATKFASLPRAMFYFEDSQVILLYEASSHNVWRSPDEASNWARVPTVPDSVCKNLLRHPFDKNTAYILTDTNIGYISTDQGASWRELKFPLPPVSLDISQTPLAFHAERSNYVLFTGMKCESGAWGQCSLEMYYTLTAFDSPSKKLLSNAQDCIWAKSSTKFELPPTNTIYCLESFAEKNERSLRLIYSEDFFETKKVVSLNGDVLGIGVKEKFLIAAVKSLSGLLMYVCTDGTSFSRAEFPLDSNAIQEGYTILESSSNSITVNLLESKNANSYPPFGTLYYSNSIGTSFRKSLPYVNRNAQGQVDFERIQVQDFEGIIFLNIVDNHEEMSKGLPDEFKNLVTMVSFNNGATFDYLKPPTETSRSGVKYCTGGNKNCALHLHLITHPHNLGLVLSSEASPGFVLGVGSVGPKLLSYDECDTFLSLDGGLTWKVIAVGPHKYETADMGSIIFLVKDAGPTDEIVYSSNHGSDWTTQKVELPTPQKWIPRLTVLDTDSTSSKVVVFVTGEKTGEYIISFDFKEVNPTKCTESDMEKWTPKQATGSTGCFLGKEFQYSRRKASAKCSIQQKFKNPQLDSKNCDCTSSDYECDINYVFDPALSKCNPLNNDANLDQPYDCKIGTKYKGSSGYRKIPGDSCNGALFNQIEKTCMDRTGKTPTSGGHDNGGTVSPPNNKDPRVVIKEIDGFVQHIEYLPKSKIVFAFDSLNGISYISSNEGTKWDEVKDLNSKGGRVKLIGVNKKNSKRAYFFVEKDNAIWFWGDDTGEVSLLNTDGLPYNTLNVPSLEFHPTNDQYLIFVGNSQKIDSCPGKSCFTKAILTKDHGRSWVNIDDWVQKCAFAKSSLFSPNGFDDDAVYCLAFKYKKGTTLTGGQETLKGKNSVFNPLQLVLYTNGGRDKKIIISEGAVGFYSVSSIFVVAKEVNNVIRLVSSTDGITLTEGLFPQNVNVQRQGFTVLESSSGGVFLDSSQNDEIGAEYGTLFISNKDGTQFTPSIKYTNRNNRGYVDFERVKGIDGILVCNVVINPSELAIGNGVKKNIRSKISFDNGEVWGSIVPPKFDSKGKELCAGLSSEDCQLNFHFNVESNSEHSNEHASGVMIACGNVGSKLGEYNDGDMFITRDAGRTWSEIRKDAHKWAIGDHGGVIVLVYDEGPTDTLFYSWDFGKKWASYRFSTRSLKVSKLSIEPTSTSHQFLITGAYKDGSTTKTLLIGVDFEDLFGRKCNGKDLTAASDFEKWDVGLAEGDRCFLGSKVSYWRRKSDALCRVGLEFVELGEDSIPCECTAQDYECDKNFWRNSEKKCVLFSRDPNQPKICDKTYTGSNGYRKILLSKCKDGVQLEQDKTVRECNKFEKEIEGEIYQASRFFDHEMDDVLYFNGTNVVVFRDTNSECYSSINNGVDWNRLFASTDLKVLRILPDPYRQNRMFFITDSSKIFYSTSDLNMIEISTKSIPSMFGGDALKTHPTEENYLIWNGMETSPLPHSVTSYSIDMGKNWVALDSYVTGATGCQWGRSDKFTIAPLQSIYCQSFVEKTGNQELMDYRRHDVQFHYKKDLASKDWVSVVATKVVGFAVFERYMVNDKSTELDLRISKDGSLFSLAVFPANFKIPDLGYTILESSTGRIFLDVYVNNSPNAQFGTLFISDYNGTDYTQVFEGTNRNRDGYVDFEKMQGIKGIAMVNQITNIKEVKVNGKKKIASKITFDDGKTWDFINPPSKSVTNEKYECSNNACSLHFHAFTERHDKMDMFSTSSAVGMMVGVGNVGKSLTEYNDAKTYITRDAGRSWTEVVEDAHMFEIGNRGSIIVLVNDEIPVNSIKYSLDQGLSFTVLKLNILDGNMFTIKNIVTDGSGLTAKFILFGYVSGGTGETKGKTLVHHIDFKNVYPRDCILDKVDTTKSDYEKFVPELEKGKPGVEYYRRKPEALCYILPDTISEVDSTACDCRKEDFDCDVDFSIQPDGTCKLNSGKTARALECVNGFYQYSTGYIKRASNMCKGGDELDLGTSYSCGSSGGGGLGFFGWLVILLISIGIVYGGFWIYINYRHLFSRGGRIRLPTSDEFAGSSSRYASRALEITKYVLRASLVYTLEFGEMLVKGGRRGVDWVRDRFFAQSRGYQPLRTYDGGFSRPVTPDLHNHSLFDLDDEVEEL